MKSKRTTKKANGGELEKSEELIVNFEVFFKIQDEVAHRDHVIVKIVLFGIFQDNQDEWIESSQFKFKMASFFGKKGSKTDLPTGWRLPRVL